MKQIIDGAFIAMLEGRDLHVKDPMNGLFGGNRRPNDQSFYDYKTAKEEKRGTAQYAILISGVVFIALSLAFLAVYYN